MIGQFHRDVISALQMPGGLKIGETDVIHTDLSTFY
jgi:hypothetical protein